MPTKIKGLTGVDKVEAGAVITNPSFSGNATVTGSLTVGGVNVFSGPYRNLIINGDMQVAQRGTSFTGLSAGLTFPVDRWTFQMNSIGTWSASQDNDVPSGQGFAKSIKINCTTADASLAASDYVLTTHRFEGQNLQQLKKGTNNAEKLTYSFWVKSNKTGTYVVEFRDGDNARINCQSYIINASDTWEKKIITIDGDTTGTFDNDNALSFEIIMWLGAGSTFTSGTLQTSWAANNNANRAVGQVNLADSTSNYINITGVQLEVGEGASDFEFLPYDVQLARCERYFQKSFRQEDAPAQNSHSGEGEHRFTIIGTGFGTLMTVYLTTTMRGYPSVTTYNPHNTNNLARNTSIPADISGIGVGNLSNNSFVIVAYGTNHDTTNGFQASIHWTASSEL